MFLCFNVHIIDLNSIVTGKDRQKNKNFPLILRNDKFIGNNGVKFKWRYLPFMHKLREKKSLGIKFNGYENVRYQFLCQIFLYEVLKAGVPMLPMISRGRTIGGIDPSMEITYKGRSLCTKSRLLSQKTDWSHCFGRNFQSALLNLL